MSIQLLAAFVISSFAGTLMFLQGVSARLLERRPVRCRACGRVLGGGCICDRD